MSRRGLGVESAIVERTGPASGGKGWAHLIGSREAGMRS